MMSTAEPASSSEEENSVDAAEEQPGAEGIVQQEVDREVERLPASSQPQGEALQPRQKRHLSRSLDLSRGSVTSRAVKHQKQGGTLTAGGHAVTPEGGLLCIYELTLPTNLVSSVVNVLSFLTIPTQSPPVCRKHRTRVGCTVGMV